MHSKIARDGCVEEKERLSWESEREIEREEKEERETFYTCFMLGLADRLVSLFSFVIGAGLLYKNFERPSDWMVPMKKKVVENLTWRIRILDFFVLSCIKESTLSVR